MHVSVLRARPISFITGPHHSSWAAHCFTWELTVVEIKLIEHKVPKREWPGYHDGCIVRISESLPIGECHLGGAAAWVAWSRGGAGKLDLCYRWCQLAVWSSHLLHFGLNTSKHLMSGHLNFRVRMCNHGLPFVSNIVWDYGKHEIQFHFTVLLQKAWSSASSHSFEARERAGNTEKNWLEAINKISL